MELWGWRLVLLWVAYGMTASFPRRSDHAQHRLTSCSWTVTKMVERTPAPLSETRGVGTHFIHMRLSQDFGAPPKPRVSWSGRPNDKLLNSETSFQTVCSKPIPIMNNKMSVNLWYSLMIIIHHWWFNHWWFNHWFISPFSRLSLVVLEGVVVPAAVG